MVAHIALHIYAVCRFGHFGAGKPGVHEGTGKDEILQLPSAILFFFFLQKNYYSQECGDSPAITYRAVKLPLVDEARSASQERFDVKPDSLTIETD